MTDDGDLWSPDEDARRFAIIECSRNADGSMMDRLTDLLHTDTEANRRHVVRALGRIGGPVAERELLALLADASGLILGDVARALGMLGVASAMPQLEALCSHELEWVRDSARWAVDRLSQ